MSERVGHLQCPFCEAYEVERLYMASVRLDSCICDSCGARWEEDPVTGEYRGRSAKQSVLDAGLSRAPHHPSPRS
jgi:transposase-like protein